MVTSPEYQPAPFGEVVGEPARDGGVLSAAGAVDDVFVVFPAASVAVPPTVTPGATVLELVVSPSARQLAMPEGSPPPEFESAHAKVTVVVPSAFLTCAAVMLGAALSTRTVTDPGRPTLPRRSVAVEVRVTMPLAVTLADAGVGPLATPDPASVAVHVTVVSVLFQPAAFGAGESAAVTAGPVLSTVYDGWVVTDPPLQLLALKFGDAATITTLAPSTAVAVVVKVHDVFAVAEVCLPIPVTVTHFVSFDVVTFSVRLAPVFAKRLPPTDTVPDPPEKVAELMLRAKAGAALWPAITIARMVPSPIHARRRREVRSGVAVEAVSEVLGAGVRRENMTSPSGGALGWARRVITEGMGSGDG
jgi:hypothetical protein